MMTLYSHPPQKKWKSLAARPVPEKKALGKKVSKILENVKRKGDKALRKYNLKFDRVETGLLEVTPEEFSRAESILDPGLKKAILQAKENIYKYHLAQQETMIVTETQPGIRCWRRAVPIEKVGLYIPGGSAPLFSTVLMLAIPAQIAGCREIICCTPPARDGSIHPAILYAASLCGVTRVFKTGGAQAIAAMTWGTETIPAVFKIFGPGNPYVTEAKMQVQQQGVAIDMPAGPSELLVIADETADPGFVASDLLSQAEHGPDSQVILVTTSKTLAEKVQAAVPEQLEQLPRKKIAAIALQHSRILLLNNLEEAVRFSNQYAPEHLILACAGAENISAQITAAGSVFLGNYSPESAGDYASGTNHTLPTNGYAAMYSGVSLDSFVKKISYQQLSPEGLRTISDSIMTMADAEGLEAHRNAVAIRLKN